MCAGLFAALAPARRSLYRVYKNPPGTLSNSYAPIRTCAMQVKDLRAKLDPDIRYRRDQQAPGDISRTTMKENFDDHSDLARGTGRRNGRAEAPNRLPAVLGRSRCFRRSQNAQCSPGAGAAQGATQHQSLPPADARRQQGAEHRHILIMLARFQQRNERQEVPDEGATPMPSDVETISIGRQKHRARTRPL